MRLFTKIIGTSLNRHRLLTHDTLTLEGIDVALPPDAKIVKVSHKTVMSPENSALIYIITTVSYTSTNEEMAMPVDPSKFIPRVTFASLRPGDTVVVKDKFYSYFKHDDGEGFYQTDGRSKEHLIGGDVYKPEEFAQKIMGIPKMLPEIYFTILPRE